MVILFVWLILCFPVKSLLQLDQISKNLQSLCQSLIPTLNVLDYQMDGRPWQFPIHYSITFEHNAKLYLLRAQINNSNVRTLPTPLGTNEVTNLPKLEKKSSQYYFDPNHKAFLLKDTASIVRLSGFNQIWIGCPQPLCFVGWIDGAFYEGQSGEVYFFRGSYVWKWWPDQYRELRAEPVAAEYMQNIEAAWIEYVANNNSFKMHFHRNARVAVTSKYPPDQVEHHNAQIYFRDRSFGQVQFDHLDAIERDEYLSFHIFQGSTYTYVSRGSTVAVMHYMFHDVDAVYIISTEMYVISNWKVFKYQLSAQQPAQSPERPEVALFDLLPGCIENLYRQANFSSKQQYVDVIVPKIFPHNSRIWESASVKHSITAKMTRENRRKWIIIFILVLLWCLILGSLILVLALLSPARIRKRNATPKFKRKQLKQKRRITKWFRRKRRKQTPHYFS